MRTEALFVGFQQPMAMAALLFSHFLEYLCGIRIAFGKILGEAHIDSAVLLLGGNRDRKHLALGQIGEILHGNAFFTKFRIRIILILAKPARVNPNTVSSY